MPDQAAGFTIIRPVGQRPCRADLFHLFKISAKYPIRIQITIERGGHIVAVATRSGRGNLDKRIDEFCETAADLLTSIHERCNNKENGKKAKKIRRCRKKKAESE